MVLVLDQGMRVDDQSKKADKQLIKTLSQDIKANRQKYTDMAKEVKNIWFKTQEEGSQFVSSLERRSPSFQSDAYRYVSTVAGNSGKPVKNVHSKQEDTWATYFRSDSFH